MRIGIDAKWYFDGPISNKIVIRHLVDHFVAVNQEDELFFFLDKKSREKEFPHKAENIHKVYVWAGINQLSNVFILPHYAQKLKLDCVLFQNFGAFYGNFRKIAYIHDVIFLSDPQYFSLKERLYFAPMRWLSRFSDLIITISQSEKRRMVQYKIAPADKIQVILHGNDPEFKPKVALNTEDLQQVKDKFGLPDQYILFVGRLNIRKNIQGLLRALCLIENQTLPLVIVGSPEWKTFDIHQEIKQLNLENRVVFTGSVSTEELIVIYALSQYFCFPSFAEGFGLPALEAMSAGIPTIVSDNSSLPEVCGDAALYIQPHHPKTIAKAIDTLENDPKLRLQLSQKGMDRVKLFDWKKTATEILNIIKTN